MARGWESKGVEQQQEEAARGRTPARPPLTPDEREREQKRQQLQLALARTQADYQSACRPAHRDMLRLRLDAIQSALRDLR